MAQKRSKRAGKAGKRPRARRSKKTGQRGKQAQLPGLSVEELAMDRSAAFSAGQRRQPSRMFKAACPKCGYCVRIARGWVTKAGLPACPTRGHGKLTDIGPELTEAMEGEADE